MKKTLEELSQMQGLNGAFLCSDDGDLIEFSAPAFYDRDIFSQAASIAARAADSMSVQHSDWDTMVCHFADGKLLLVRLESHILCVLADANLNLPFVNVAIRVAKKKLQKKIESGQSGMGASSMTSNAGVSPYSSQTGGDSQIHAAPTNPSARAAASSFHSLSSMSNALDRQNGSFFQEASESGMYWSGMGGSGMQSSAVVVADEASSQLLTKVGNALAVAVGPMAKVFIKEAVRRICPSEPFSTRHLRKLMADLEQHISDPEELKEFQDKVFQ